VRLTTVTAARPIIQVMPDPPPELSPDAFGALFKRFMESMTAAAAIESPLHERIAAHVGDDPRRLAVMVEELDAFEHPNVQVALDDYLAGDGRQFELIGIAAENRRFQLLALSDFLSRRTSVELGPVERVNFHLDDDRVLPCVQFGLYLVRDREVRLAVLVTGPADQLGPSRARVRVDVVGTSAEACQAFLGELRASMRRLNVYRGKAISLSPGQPGMGAQTLVVFHALPAVSREDVVLPPGLLERVERHTVVFAQHAERLLSAGRSLKRGLLLYGPPGTGKTLTVTYLAGRMPGRTVILTTGRGMGMTRVVAQMARSLAPSMVVLEDVDLIAEHRGQQFHPTGPLLFDLLNEMDGLGDDADVIFALTTNRPDILEPALAARPGRIDLAVELSLPDATARRRLLELYARGLTLTGVDVEALVAATDGVSPAYIKELLRKAALVSAEAGADAVAQEHMEAATAELAEGGRLAERLLGFRPMEQPAPEPPTMPTGFPAGARRTRFER
jgi:hypothetical protein